MQRCCIAAGMFLHECQNSRTRYASHTPGGEDGAVNRRQLLHAENIGKVSRHAGESATVAADDEKYKGLENESFRSNRKMVESPHFQGKEDHVHHARANPVGNGGPENPSAPIDDTDDTYQGGCLYRRHADDFLGHRGRYRQKTDTAGDVCKENPPESIPFPGVHSFLPCHLGSQDRTLIALRHFSLQHIFQHHRDFSLLRRTEIGSGE